MIERIKLSYFNNIEDVTPKTKTYLEYLDMIQSENIFFDSQRVRSLKNITREDKSHTPNVSINYTFSGKRDTKGIDVSTPILELEFDIKQNKHINIETLKEDIKNNPHPSLILCAYTLSGKGLLLHFLIDDLNIEFKREIWKTLVKWFNETYKTTINFDASSLNDVYVRYIAFDADPYINLTPKPFVYTKFFEEKQVNFVPTKKVRQSEKLLKDYTLKLKSMGYELKEGHRNNFIVKLTYFAFNNLIKLSTYESFLNNIYPEYFESEHKKTVKYIYSTKKPKGKTNTVKELNIENRITEISEQVTNEIVSNKKILIQAETGSGKSHYIFNDLLPFLKSNIYWEDDVVILCATPLKFLTIQQKNYLKKSNLKYEIVCEGHTSAKNITREVLYDKHLIQTTFESLKEIYKKCVEHNVKVILLIDEVHQLITSSHYMRLGELKETIDYASFFVGFSGTVKDIYDNYYDFNVPLLNISTTTPKNEVVEHIELPSKNHVVEEICGRLTNLFSKNILNDKKYLIFLNNTDKIEQCYEFCLHKGIKADRVHRNLSKIDENSLKTLKHISEKESLPENIDVLFTTSLLDTGVNITNENLEIWYFSHLNDNDTIKFEQSINRYRSNTKSIKLFTIAQKRVEMYRHLVNAGKNALRDNRIARYFSKHLQYINTCILKGELTFPELKPTVFKYSKTQIKSIISQYHKEVDKLNDIIKLKKELNIDGLDIEFIKTKEKSDLNTIIDYCFYDDKGFYNLDVFKVINKLRTEEINSITNDFFIQKLKKEGRKITNKNRANINNTNEIEEQEEAFEAKKELVQESIFKLLRRGVKDPYMNLKCFFENVSTLTNDEYVKKESQYVFENIERIFDIDIIELDEEKRKEHFNNYKFIYTNTKVYTTLLKNFLKLFNSFKYLDKYNYHSLTDWDTWVNLTESNLEPKEAVQISKSIYYQLNTEVFKNYNTKGFKTNSIVELQTIYIKNFIEKFDKELGNEVLLADIMKKVKELPRINGVEMSNAKEEKVVNLLKMFYNVTSVRRRMLGRMERIYTFVSKKDFEFYFDNKTKQTILTKINSYVADKISNNDKVELNAF